MYKNKQVVLKPFEQKQLLESNTGETKQNRSSAMKIVHVDHNTLVITVMSIVYYTQYFETLIPV